MTKQKPKPKPFENVDELVDAMRSLAELVPEDDGAVTARELEMKLQWSEGRVYQMLHALKEEGRLESLKIKREQLDGSWRRVAGYKVRP